MKKEPPKTIPAFANLPEDFGRIVRYVRQKSNLRQAQAAALCGVGTRFLSDLENGKPTLHLGKVLQVLQVPKVMWEVQDPKVLVEKME